MNDLQAIHEQGKQIVEQKQRQVAELEAAAQEERRRAAAEWEAKIYNLLSQILPKALLEYVAFDSNSSYGNHYPTVGLLVPGCYGIQFGLDLVRNRLNGKFKVAGEPYLYDGYNSDEGCSRKIIKHQDDTFTDDIAEAVYLASYRGDLDDALSTVADEYNERQMAEAEEQRSKWKRKGQQQESEPAPLDQAMSACEYALAEGDYTKAIALCLYEMAFAGPLRIKLAVRRMTDQGDDLPPLEESPSVQNYNYTVDDLNYDAHRERSLR